MNTDTPETDASAWTETNWANACVTADFARKLERERDEARERLTGIEIVMRAELGGHPDSELWGDAGLIAATMRCVDALDEVTEQRDEARAENIGWQNKWQVAVEMAALAQNELTAITEQRDRYKLACDQYSEDEILCKLQEVTEQRDRLAEALRECLERLEHHTEFGALVQADMSAMHSSREALQSLTPKP
jgi:hypothetical protein